MKIKWRWTLSKKIFLLLLAGFCLINICNVYLDYDNEKQHAYNNLRDRYFTSLVYELSNEFHKNYSQINQDYLTYVDKELSNKEYITSTVFVMNKNNQIVYNLLEQKNMTLSLTDTQYNSLEDMNTIQFSFNSIEEKVKESFEQFLLNNKAPGTFHIFVASPRLDRIRKNGEWQVMNDLSYLAVGDKVFLDRRQNNEKVHEYIFDSYDSQNILVSKSSIVDEDRTPQYRINYQDMKQMMLDYLGINNQNTLTHEENGCFERDKTLYDVICIPLISKDRTEEYENNYTPDDVEGYLIYYAYDYFVIDSIINKVIVSKMGTYALSLFLTVLLSILLSYMLTRRIKKIDQSTLAIAHNQFDNMLDERSKDELGTLSHNINTMSQQLKQTIHQLNEEINHVKQLESVRKEFIANFTHEIKTPLGIINGYIELIEEINDEDKKKKYLEAINQETDRINELVLAMLNLSRLESGSVELNIQDTDLEDLITGTIESFASLLERKQIKVHLTGLYPKLKIDAFEMQMVFKNFMSNAIKHTPEDGSIYINYEDNKLYFENDGVHINEDQKERIWDTYVSRDRDGTGLGLAICKTILDMHGFSYDVYNTERGVCFKIDFSQTS